MSPTIARLEGNPELESTPMIPPTQSLQGTGSVSRCSWQKHMYVLGIVTELPQVEIVGAHAEGFSREGERDGENR